MSARVVWLRERVFYLTKTNRRHLRRAKEILEFAQRWGEQELISREKTIKRHIRSGEVVLLEEQVGFEGRRRLMAVAFGVKSRHARPLVEICHTVVAEELRGKRFVQVMAAGALMANLLNDMQFGAIIFTCHSGNKACRRAARYVTPAFGRAWAFRGSVRVVDDYIRRMDQLYAANSHWGGEPFMGVVLEPFALEASRMILSASQPRGLQWMDGNARIFLDGDWNDLEPEPGGGVTAPQLRAYAGGDLPQVDLWDWSKRDPRRLIGRLSA